MSDNQASNSSKFSKEEIEEKLKGIQATIQTRLNEEKPTLFGVAVGVGVLLTGLAYFAGKRKGRKQSAYVEIRRG